MIPSTSIMLFEIGLADAKEKVLMVARTSTLLIVPSEIMYIHNYR
jgi:hypothetical protein